MRQSLCICDLERPFPTALYRRSVPPCQPPSSARGGTWEKPWASALRHACARRLVDAGLSLKEIGDHLGHRSPDATRMYAKVDLASLRLVAMEDLGGLA